ncbi:MAG: (d)CMP kinase [Candidatus Krumholzibacteriia bacterium]|nr:(d)CMP kinase [bacterium]MCB9515144.1 (d)CMP kinase [Candidatus Latescibacterota bacterium]
MLITIDGPAASGKSTTARAVAERLGLDYLDTGALYRGVTLAALRKELAAEEGPALSAFLASLHLRYRVRRGQVQILLDGEDVSDEIRDAAVTARVSDFSALPSLRAHMVEFQRHYARGRNVIAEGRDMGSVVFPEADLKVFLEADPQVRAHRRAEEFAERGRDVEDAVVAAELEARDSKDAGRSHSPLVKPEGAVVLDNSRLSIEEQVEAVLRLAEQRWPAARVDPETLLYHAPGGNAAVPRMRLSYRLAWSFVRLTLRLLFGLRYVHAERAAMGGPLIVASNHISWLDPPAVGSGLPREMTFVAKRELFAFKPFGALIGYFNAVPIRRGTFDRVCFDVLRRRIQAGGAVLFFPEGTRKPVGRLGRAKFGMGLVAKESGAPVLPVYVKGSTRWKRALLRRERVEVWIGRPLHIAPLAAQGHRGRELLDLFGEGVMAEIARLQDEAGGAFDPSPR